MFFQKIPHPANFRFAPLCEDNAQPSAGFPLEVASLGGDVFRLRPGGVQGQTNESQAELATEVPGDVTSSIELTKEGGLRMLAAGGGTPFLEGAAGGTFGVAGSAWMFRFRLSAAMRFYGLGEHLGGLEKRGQRVQFWNVDLLGDMAHDEIRHGHPMPSYVSVPYLIVKSAAGYAGILVHHPGAVFMDLGADIRLRTDDKAPATFYLGAPDGAPELYLLAGPTLPELTRKLQTLVGRTPRPPLWALGHHQCRWGYAGPADLAELDTGYREHGIPCDGLWLDIDYMDGFRVFTLAPEHWGSPAEAAGVLQGLRRRGRRVVPILDPGVKVDPGYTIYEEGLARDLFCHHREGAPFVGMVWPGEVHFPDFSLPEAQVWWANQVEAFALLGFSAAWLDMNDPSVGKVDPADMLFARGSRPHASYHNQYALGMARASHAGFLAARPDERPFLLTRSAYLSTSRYAAVWTGDNASNWHNLRLSLPVSLGLALSGIPFNGADVGGFMDDTSPELTVAWYKAAFLFPILRNHSAEKTRRQEPWALGEEALSSIRHYIRLRYKFLPYLYSLFIAQEATGEAILRPLCHDFASTEALPLDTLEDQFLVGPDILQAPVLEEDASTRQVVLPGEGRWFSAQDGAWHAGGQVLEAHAPDAQTPLFLREGALLPLQVGTREDNDNDLSDLEIHCILDSDTSGRRILSYRCDDGESFAYRHGAETDLGLSAEVREGALHLTVDRFANRFSALRLRFVTYATFRRVIRHTPEGERTLRPEDTHVMLTGAPLEARMSEPVILG
ncbi:MAG: glycoside hydrolase family 31 protein [Opitutales bacterium]